MAYAVNGNDRIHYQVEGEGTPLVLYHGMSESLQSWRDYGYAQVLRRDYRLILIDGRGHGDSDKPDEPEAYALAPRVADVTAVLDAERVDQAHYVGYSLGGWTGLGLLKYAHGRLRSLTIGGAQPFGQSMAVYRQILAGGMAAWVETVERMAGPLPAEQRRRLLANDPGALRASVTNDRPNIAEMLPSVRVPCLLFAGQADPLHDLVARCARELPNAEFISLPGLNHIQTIGRSDLILPHLTRFLAKVEGAAVVRTRL